jgi:hypothetical protein
MSKRTILQFPKALEIIKEYKHRKSQHRRRQFWVLGAFRVRCEKLLLASLRRSVGMNIRMEQLSAYMTDFYLNIYREILLKSADQLKVCLNSNKNDKRSSQGPDDICVNTQPLTKFVKQIRYSKGGRRKS